MPRFGRYRRLNYAFDSLLGEILVWVLILLLMLWSMSIVMTYHVANTIAHRPYDELLADNVRALAKFVHEDGRTVKSNFPASMRDFLHSDRRDKIFFQILAPSGALMVGDADMPWAATPEKVEPEAVLFRDEEIGGEEVRVAYMFVPVGNGLEAVLVQLGETGNKRQALTAHIVSGLIVPQFVIVPIAAIFVYLAISRGITPLHRLQEQLRERRPTDLSPISVKGIPSEITPMIGALNGVMMRLEDNLNAQRRFIADAAHQLKTPLTGLRAQTELALEEPEVEGMRERLRQIAISAERVSRLTQQLLSLARAEATTESSAAFQTMDLNEVARGVTLDWADRAIGQGVNFGFEASDRPLTMTGSPFLIGEMLNNLIDNAIRYTPAGGQVTVRLRGEGGVVLYVDDTGLGIPAADRQNVFERFYRVLGTNTDGSGLGLAIVREIADLHAGKIDLGDGPNGCGTRVAVRFPAATA